MRDLLSGGWAEVRAVEVVDEDADGFVEILVAIALQAGVVGALGERPEGDVRCGDRGATTRNWSDGVVRVVAGDGLAEVDLVVEFEDEVGGGGVGDELEAVEGGEPW